MPLYEYVCLDCRNQFDALRPIIEADATIFCAACNSDHTSRMISLFNARSGNKLIAGGNTNACTSCKSHACSTCGS
jgi:putative FmdB family regulatory protein